MTTCGVSGGAAAAVHCYREITLYGKTDCLDSTEIVRVRGETSFKWNITPNVDFSIFMYLVLEQKQMLGKKVSLINSIAYLTYLHINKNLAFVA